MSRVVFSKKGKVMFYIESCSINSYGYIVDYTKGDSSKDISYQCKIKIVDYVIGYGVFASQKGSKKIFMDLKKKYPGKNNVVFVIHDLDNCTVICVQKVSNWEHDLLTEKQISHMILFENMDFPKEIAERPNMITFNS